MKYILIAILSFGTLQLMGAGSSWDKTAPACQILDKAPSPLYSLDFTYISDSHFDNFGNSSIAEIDGYLELGYFYDVLAGSLDLNLDLDLTLFSSGAEMQLPNQLMALRLDTGLTWRYINGMALQVRIAPGIYSDVESISLKNLYMPFSIAGIKRFNPEISAIAGIEVRAGFEQIVMPVVGAVWAPDASLRLEATLPDARATYYWNNVCNSYIGWSWENMTYSIREKGDYDRKKITLESYRTYLGTSYALSDQFHLVGEAGLLSGRSVEFKETADGVDDSTDISSELFVKFGITGPF